MNRTWQILDSISPVFSDWGFKNWDLCFASDGIVAVRGSLWISVRAGAWAGIGNPGAARNSWSAKAAPQRGRILEDKGATNWRRYFLEEIEYINLQRRIFTASEIRIKKRGQEVEIYGVGDFREIMRARIVLKELYPTLYSENGRWPKRLY